MMHGPEKSDLAIVAMKPANKAGQPAAEWVEPRAGTEGNTGQPRTRRTQSRGSVSQGLDRVRQRCKAAEEGEVHRAAAPRHGRSAEGCVPGAQAPCRTRSGRRDVAGLRGGAGGQPPGPARAGPTWHVPGAARQATVHPEADWQTAPAGDCRAGRQNRPARGGHGAQRDLRGRLPRVLVRVPARAQSARCAGCLGGGDPRYAGELDSRRRYPELLRHDRPGMAGPIPGASDRRRARHPSCAQVAQGGRPGRRGMERQ